MSWDVLDECMEGNDWFDAPLLDGDEGSGSAGNDLPAGSGEPPPAPVPGGRRRRARGGGGGYGQVEGEKERGVPGSGEADGWGGVGPNDICAMARIPFCIL